MRGSFPDGFLWAIRSTGSFCESAFGCQHHDVREEVRHTNIAIDITGTVKKGKSLLPRVLSSIDRI